LPGAVLFSEFRSLNKTAIPNFAKYFSFSLIAVCALLVIDLYTRAGPFFLTHEVDPDVDNFSNLNRSTIALLFFSFASAYAVLQSGRITAKIKRILWGALAVLLAAILYKTDSQSAQLGAVLAAIMWFGFPIRSKAIWILLAVILSAAILTAPWAVQIAHNHFAEAASQSGALADAYVASRLEIWDFVARKALESPWIGYGMEATRNIEQFDSAKRFMPLDYVLHPHNFALQIWIEFGALGAVMAAAFINCVLYHIYKHPCPRDRRFMLTIFVTLLALAATSYGLWQGWWLGVFVHMAAFCALLQTLEKPQSEAA
jgi:O-antigen ligase